MKALIKSLGNSVGPGTTGAEVSDAKLWAIDKISNKIIADLVIARVINNVNPSLY